MFCVKEKAPHRAAALGFLFLLLVMLLSFLLLLLVRMWRACVFSNRAHNKFQVT